MIITLNDKVVHIDISGIPEMVDFFKAKHILIAKEHISEVKIKDVPHQGEMLELYTADLSTHVMHYTQIQSINGLTNYSSNLDVLNIIKHNLYGL